MGDPFRDEEHAALMRAAHLEEENTKLRAELEAARNPPKDPSVEDAAKGTRHSHFLYVAIAGGFVSAAVVSLFLLAANSEEVEPQPEIVLVDAPPLETVPAAVIATPPLVYEWGTEASGTTAELHAFAQGARPAVGYAVGSGGTVLRHFAGGNDPWTLEKSGTTEALYGVAENLGVVCAVGLVGTVICALDPTTGIWKAEKSGTTKDLLAVSASGGQSGFVAVGQGGAIIRRDSERPARWVVEASGTAVDLHGTIGGYAVGDHGTILRRDDGRWVIEPSGTTEDLYAIESNVNDIVIVGAHGTILRHSDPRGGWKPEPSGTDGDLLSVTRGDAGYDFIAVGANGIILRSPNRGQAWSRMTGRTDRDLHFVAGTIPMMYAVGADGTILAKRY